MSLILYRVHIALKYSYIGSENGLINLKRAIWHFKSVLRPINVTYKENLQCFMQSNFFTLLLHIIMFIFTPSKLLKQVRISTGFQPDETIRIRYGSNQFDVFYLFLVIRLDILLARSNRLNSKKNSRTIIIIWNNCGSAD